MISIPTTLLVLNYPVDSLSRCFSMLNEIPLNILCNTSSFLSEKMGRTPINDVRFETDGQIKGVWACSLPFFQFVRLRSDMQVNGELPAIGAALIISNHISSLDPFWAYYLAAETAHRSMRAWAKKSLLDPRYKETAKSDAGRTHKDKVDGFIGLMNRLVLVPLIKSPYARSFDPIAATIGGQNREAIRETRKALDDDQLIWMFIQGHRRPRGDLLAYMPGAAYLVLGRPDLPIYPVGFSGTEKGIFAPKVLNIGEHFTLNQIREEVPQIATMSTTERVERLGLYMVDKIAPLLVDKKHKAAWINGRALMDQFGLGRERLLRRVPLDPDLSLTRRLLMEEYPNHPYLSPVEFLEQLAA